ncbi:TPA: hypothetical protein ACUI23_001948 [Staphylococcus pseudintermedius]
MNETVDFIHFKFWKKMCEKENVLDAVILQEGQKTKIKTLFQMG